MIKRRRLRRMAQSGTIANQEGAAIYSCHAQDRMIGSARQGEREHAGDYCGNARDPGQRSWCRSALQIDMHISPLSVSFFFYDTLDQNIRFRWWVARNLLLHKRNRLELENRGVP
jgi:hypothetical protein